MIAAMIVVSTNSRSIVPTPPALTTNHWRPLCAYGVTVADRSSALISANCRHPAVILSPTKGTSSSTAGGAGNVTDSSDLICAAMLWAFLTMVVSASAIGTNTTSRIIVVMMATASARRPPSRICRRKRNGHVATLTIVAQRIDVRKGLTIQTVANTRTARKRTANVVWVMSVDARCRSVVSMGPRLHTACPWHVPHTMRIRQIAALSGAGR
jgi:hypothetical protein